MFANRLRKNLRHLGKWARREGVTCYRVYDGDLPEYALAVDLYENWAHVQEYAAPATVDPAVAQARLRAGMSVIPDALGIPADRVVLKVRRRQKGLAQYERQAATGQFRTVHEGGLRFLVNLTDYLDTGLFLDHRPTRALIRGLAAGRSLSKPVCLHRHCQRVCRGGRGRLDDHRGHVLRLPRLGAAQHGAERVCRGAGAPLRAGGLPGVAGDVRTPSGTT